MQTLTPKQIERYRRWRATKSLAEKFRKAFAAAGWPSLPAPTLKERFQKAFEKAGWPRLDYAKHKPAAGQKGMFDEEDHPRDDDGQFTAGSAKAESAAEKSADKPLDKSPAKETIDSGGSEDRKTKPEGKEMRSENWAALIDIAKRNPAYAGAVEALAKLSEDKAAEVEAYLAAGSDENRCKTIARRAAKGMKPLVPMTEDAAKAAEAANLAASQARRDAIPPAIQAANLAASQAAQARAEAAAKRAAVPEPSSPAKPNSDGNVRDKVAKLTAGARSQTDLDAIVARAGGLAKLFADEFPGRDRAEFMYEWESMKLGLRSMTRGNDDNKVEAERSKPVVPKPAATQPAKRAVSIPFEMAEIREEAKKGGAKHNRTARGEGKPVSYDGYLGGGKRDAADRQMREVGEIIERKDGPWLVTAVQRPNFVKEEEAEDMGHFGVKTGWYGSYTAVPVERTAQEEAAKQTGDATAAHRAALHPSNFGQGEPVESNKLPAGAYRVSDAWSGTSGGVSHGSLHVFGDDVYKYHPGHYDDYRETVSVKRGAAHQLLAHLRAALNGKPEDVTAFAGNGRHKLFDPDISRAAATERAAKEEAERPAKEEAERKHIRDRLLPQAMRSAAVSRDARQAKDWWSIQFILGGDLAELQAKPEHDIQSALAIRAKELSLPLPGQ